MQAKNLRGVTLWAVPRFHRSEIASGNKAQDKTETAAVWVDRPKTYSFSFPQDEAEAQIELQDQPQTCH